MGRGKDKTLKTFNISIVKNISALQHIQRNGGKILI